MKKKIKIYIFMIFCIFPLIIKKECDYPEEATK